MQIRRAMPVLTTTDPAGARAFYEGFLGLRVAMDQDGMFMFASTSTPTTQLIIAWASRPTAVDPRVCDVDISLEVADVDEADALAVAQGLEVLYPLTDEPWGIRRFFVRDATGRTVNVASHTVSVSSQGPAGSRGPS